MLRLSGHSNHHSITIIIQNNPIIKTINPAIANIKTKAHQANHQNKSNHFSKSKAAQSTRYHHIINISLIHNLINSTQSLIIINQTKIRTTSHFHR